MLLPHGADFPGVMYRQLLGDNEDLRQFGVHSDQFGNAVTSPGRRKIDDAAIEAMPGIQPFADAVVNGDIADCGL
jgi:hypothetical protein